MSGWWRGTALVTERGLREQLRSKTFRIVTGLLLVASLAAVIIPQLTAGGRPTYTLATVGQAPAALTSSLETAAQAGGFDVRVVERADEAEVQRAVRDGEATVGLAGQRLYVPARDAGPFSAVVSQSLVSLETARLLGELGLSQQQVAQVTAVPPPQRVPVEAVEDTGRATIGYAVGLVLYAALVFCGSAISTTVATEKSTRISEVLLAVLRPSQVLVGTVLALGLVTTLQLLVLAAPILISARFTDSSWLPTVAGGDLGLAFAWFVLGFVLYAFLYAAAGALVDKVTEAAAAVTPLTTLLIAGYLLGILLVTDSPGSPWSVFVTLFPLTAPLTMPIRWGAGDVPVWELLLAMGLTAGTAVAFVWLASSVYRRALVITGHRVRLGELVGRGHG